jgi:hypothetical protein
MRSAPTIASSARIWVSCPLPVEGMRSYVAILLKCGITPDEVRTMFHRNPARIVGLE